MPWAPNCAFSSRFPQKVAVWLGTSRWQQDPHQQRRPLPRAPCVAVGKTEGGINVERAQQAIGSNSELASRFPQQLFAGSSAVVFYSLLTSVQRCFPHLPAGVITSDLVTAQCSKSTD